MRRFIRNGWYALEEHMPNRYWHRRALTREWWAWLIRPRVPASWQEVGALHPGYAVLFHLTADGPITERTFDTEVDLLTRRSWLLPWRRFYYLDLVNPRAVRSNYYMLQHMPGYFTFQSAGAETKTVLMTADEFAETVRSTLQQGWAIAQQREPWFSPAPNRRGIISLA